MTVAVLLPPLSLYVHLPWCVRKCPYCDFNSYHATGVLPEQPYIDALLRDLDQELPYAQDRSIKTIFIGGGTPSLFCGSAIAQLLTGIRAAVPVVADAEITLEANPGAVEAERFVAFRQAGVNRLSIGVQSFRDEMLERLGRVHDGAEAVHAHAMAVEAGFDNINLDLMYGLPGDDVEGALADLERAVELSPAHLSWYQLTLEPNTAFHRKRPRLPDDDTVEAIETAGRELLAARGYERYEVSAYARSGQCCSHNVNYWGFGDYIGIGAGAHGKVTLPGEGIIRRTKQRNPRTYIQSAGNPSSVTSERIETPAQIALEYLMNGLRLVGGTRIEDFEQRTGQLRSLLARPRSEAERLAWMSADPTRLAATPAGLRRLNRLLMLFC